MQGYTFNGILDDPPISGASAFATVGLLLGGPIGLLAGSVIGGIVDAFGSAREKRRLRRRIKRLFYAQEVKRYNQQIFLSALERLGSEMAYLNALGIRPRTPEYELALQKNVKGYRGNCNLDLFFPAPPGQPQQLVARLKGDGSIEAKSEHIDLNTGLEWAQACQELNRSALEDWAQHKREDILFEQGLTEQAATARRNAITRTLSNVGLGMVLIGYLIRQKRNLRRIRGEV